MILEQFRLENKVAIVTGCSTGLGQGIAYGLAEAGADIAGVYNTTDTLETERYIKKLGRRFLSIKANLISTGPVHDIIEKTLDNFGKIDILVNNAGIIRREEVIDFTEKDWDDVMNINLKTAFFLSRGVARVYIRQKKGGKIINIASMLSFQGGIRVSSYTASKSGLMGLTRILANELAKYQINVNAIAPGYMITRNTAPLRADKIRNKEITERIPAGRWGTPDDLKGAAVFLASDASKYVNGYALAVDGGWLAR
ncbi:MAG: 2-dehydro-3-deoxy-D-gluconate 5-dehydrogenase KduD [Spirochaetales bacterium]|nr:2-dehydro-3-deoxy-D-gluconate 5-dehydrogenase KduD [Spirochaetales bacterium]